MGLLVPPRPKIGSDSSPAVAPAIVEFAICRAADFEQDAVLKSPAHECGKQEPPFTPSSSSDS